MLSIKFATIIGLLFFAVSQASEAETQDLRCERVLSLAPPTLFLTPDVYAFLGQLDDVACETISAEEFDDFLARTQLNIVSYVLLEERLIPNEPSLAPNLLQTFMESYEQTQISLDLNAMLTLLDIAYYPCAGDEICIGEQLNDYLGTRFVAEPAQCMFGLNAVCEIDELPIPIYNSATIGAAGSEISAKANRAEFFCGRYLDCMKEEN